MAEILNSTAIVPVGQDFKITVREFDAAGKSTELTTQIPDAADFRKWGLMQQVIMLKRGVWRDCDVPSIIWGLAYANSIDADVIKGEIFPTGGGRWGTSNKYKIRKALETGLVEGIETDITDTGTAITLDRCVQKTELECTVTVHVKGWKKPIVRKAKLSRWYKSANPNWRENPEHMLELNTVAHALELVRPGPTESDEAPPVETK